MGCFQCNPRGLKADQQTPTMHAKQYKITLAEKTIEDSGKDPISLLKNFKNRRELDSIAQFICWDEEEVTPERDEFKIDSYPPARSVCSIALLILSELSLTEARSIESIGIGLIPDLIALISGSDHEKRIYSLIFFQKILQGQNASLKESLVRSGIFKVLLPLINDPNTDLAALALAVSMQIYQAFTLGQNEFLKHKGEWFIAEHLRRINTYDDKYSQAIDSLILLVTVIHIQSNRNLPISKNLKKVMRTGLINDIASRSLVSVI